jgi:hypothetical protein
VSGNKVDLKAPTIAITAPTGSGTAKHPDYLSHLALTVTFSATDGGSGVSSWTLRRHLGLLTALGACASSGTVDLVVVGTAGGSSLSDPETLLKGRCYFWTLDATDAVGNVSATYTSEVVYVDSKST